MNIPKLFNPGQGSKLSIVSDPFKADKITSINLNYRKKLFETYWIWEARVNFKNGKTEGTQMFEVKDSSDYNSFEKITKEIQTFINSL